MAHATILHEAQEGEWGGYYSSLTGAGLQAEAAIRIGNIGACRIEDVLAGAQVLIPRLTRKAIFKQ